MKSLNKVQLIGNLGKDPEIRTTHSGDKVANFSIACGESWKDKSTGEKREKTEWINVVIFGNLVEIAERYLKKGSRCYLEGSIQTRKWQDQSGADRYSTEVVLKQYRGELLLLDGGGSGERERSTASDYGSRATASSRPTTNQGGGSTRRDDFDDAIPF